jgi:hypothetical protein
MKNGTKVEEILKDTINAYNIEPQHVFASRYDEQTDTMIIVTNGGQKIVHKVGGPIVRKLTEVEISGIPPKEKILWSEKLNGGIKASDLKER